MKGYRSYISLCLVLGMTVALFWQTATIIHFYLNQESIAETHCINKENPKKPNCLGQCHLKAQLEKSTIDREDEPGVPTQMETGMFILLFAPQKNDHSAISIKNYLSQMSSNEAYLENFVIDIFHPPQI